MVSGPNAPKLVAVLAASTVGAVFFLAVYALDRAETGQFQQSRRIELTNELNLIGSEAERVLNERLFSVLGLKAQVLSNPNITEAEFAKAASYLIDQSEGIRSATLIKGSTIEFVYPREPNQPAIKKDLLDLPQQRDAFLYAVGERTAILTGPVELLQGGTAFIYRDPIYFAGEQVETQKDDYWGMVSILIDRDSFFRDISENSRLTEINAAIRWPATPEKAAETFYGDEWLFDTDSIKTRISLPRGSWEIAGLPKQGWPVRSPTAWMLRVGGAALGFIAILATFLLYRTNDRYRIEKIKADEANRAKGEFLATMSHEIRTPLNAVIGFTELVLDSPLEETQREQLRIVQDSGESLLSLINDILDYSKIESGKLQLVAESFSLRQTPSEALRPLAYQAFSKGIELALRVEPTIEDHLIADAGRFRQVLINLVANAVKFTAHGEVVVDVTAKRSTSSEVELLLAVRDTGIGIPEEKLDHVFGMFQQADTTTTRQHGGTGLGLAISSQLVRLDEGRNLDRE